MSFVDWAGLHAKRITAPFRQGEDTVAVLQLIRAAGIGRVANEVRQRQERARPALIGRAADAGER
jgi:hypothetical protein